MSENEFKKIAKFTDIVAWQEGHKLVLMMYGLIKKLYIFVGVVVLASEV